LNKLCHTPSNIFLPAPGVVASHNTEAKRKPPDASAERPKSSSISRITTVCHIAPLNSHHHGTLEVMANPFMDSMTQEPKSIEVGKIDSIVTLHSGG